MFFKPILLLESTAITAFALAGMFYPGVVTSLLFTNVTDVAQTQLTLLVASVPFLLFKAAFLCTAATHPSVPVLNALASALFIEAATNSVVLQLDSYKAAHVRPEALVPVAANCVFLGLVCFLKSKQLTAQGPKSKSS